MCVVSQLIRTVNRRKRLGFVNYLSPATVHRSFVLMYIERVVAGEVIIRVLRKNENNQLKYLLKIII